MDFAPSAVDSGQLIDLIREMEATIYGNVDIKQNSYTRGESISYGDTYLKHNLIHNVIMLSLLTIKTQKERSLEKLNLNQRTFLTIYCLLIEIDAILLDKKVE